MDGFKRNISFRVDRMADRGIQLTSTLVDRFHDIALETVVDPETLRIRTVRVDFHRAPTSHCSRVQPRLDLLVGFPVGRGLTRKLMEALGGREGCGNLRLLLSGALPLALNVKAAEGAGTVHEMLETIHEKLAGTCVGYSEPAAG